MTIDHSSKPSADDAATVIPPKSRARYFALCGGGLLLLAALGGLAAMIIIPASPPKFPIRAFLPAACAVSVEIHAPAIVSRELIRENFFAALQKLPAWRQIKNFDGQKGADFDVQIAALQSALTTALAVRVGINNCAALALGVTADAQIAGLIALDRFADLTAKIASVFLPRAAVGTESETGNFRVLQMRKFAPAAGDAPDFYFAFFTDRQTSTRYLRFASSPELLTRFQFAAPPKIQSHFPLGESQAVELTVNFSPDFSSASAPIRGESFWRWHYAEITGETRIALAAPPPFAAKPLAKSRWFAPPENFISHGGLFFRSALPREILTPENLAAAAKIFLDPTLAAIITARAAGVKMLTENFTGIFAAQISPPTGQNEETVIALTAEIDNADTAAESIADGIRALISPPAKPAFFFAPTAASLIKITAANRLITLKSPLAPWEIHGVFAENSARENSGKFASAAFAIFAPAPEILLAKKFPFPPDAGAAMQINWQYAPAWDKLLAEILALKKNPLVSRGLSLAGVSPEILAANLTRLTDFNDILTSFSAFESRAFIRSAAPNAEIIHTFTGKLRLPESNGAR